MLAQGTTLRWRRRTGAAYLLAGLLAGAAFGQSASSVAAEPRSPALQQRTKQAHANAAPVEVNGASAAQLQTIAGIGPAMLARILAERARAPFQSMQDLDQRVRGVGPKTVERWQAAGLLVAPPSKAASKDLKAIAGSSRPALPLVGVGGANPAILQGGTPVADPRGRILTVP